MPSSPLCLPPRFPSVSLSLSLPLSVSSHFPSSSSFVLSPSRLAAARCCVFLRRPRFQLLIVPRATPSRAVPLSLSRGLVATQRAGETKRELRCTAPSELQERAAAEPTAEVLCVLDDVGPLPVVHEAAADAHVAVAVPDARRRVVVFALGLGLAVSRVLVDERLVAARGLRARVQASSVSCARRSRASRRERERE